VREGEHAPKLGEVVRLIADAGGMAAGAEGVLLGWYREPGRQHALVSFWDGGPLRVSAELIEGATSTGESA
jgi:hypothetical protein